MPRHAGPRKSIAPGLVMERAVQEMSQLRQDIALFMAQYEQGAVVLYMTWPQEMARDTRCQADLQVEIGGACMHVTIECAPVYAR
jgi:hypothetical protein